MPMKEHGPSIRWRHAVVLNKYRSSGHFLPLTRRDGTRTYQQWRERWFIEEPGLHDAYQNDFQAFIRAYQMADSLALELQEEGMEAFVKLIEKETERARYIAYEARATALLQNLITTLTSPTPELSSENDFIIASIDFEGDTTNARGITGFGLTKLDTRKLLAPNRCASESLLDCANYRFRCRDNKVCLFGPSYKYTQEQIADVIRRNLCEREDGTGKKTGTPRNIILIAHSLNYDLRRLERIGLRLEDLPGVVGIADTYEMTRQILGHGTRLRKLLLKLDIPMPGNALHNAGNDSFFTMQALLALLQKQYARSIPCLESIVSQRAAGREERRQAKAEKRQQEQDEYEEMLGECFESFGDMFGS